MYSSTEIEQGLVNRVNPISSIWAEAGYEWKNFRAYAGMLPKVISGSADITLPSGVDNRGQIQYTSTTADVYSPTVHYARFNWTLSLKLFYDPYKFYDLFNDLHSALCVVTYRFVFLVQKSQC
jgi:hypothetical protein